MSYDISVIVPIYNVKIDLFKRLLNCLVRQTVPFQDIWLVDDGSTRECVRLVRECVKNLEHVHYIEHPHGGVSATRNYGMTLVESEFVAFVDADDVIPLDFVERATAFLKRDTVDIVIGGIEFLFKNGVDRFVSRLPKGEMKVYATEQEKRSLIEQLLLDMTLSQDEDLVGCTLCTPCAKVYRTSLVQRLSFSMALSVYEDQIFNLTAFLAAGRVGLVGEIWYTYYQYGHSALHKAGDTIVQNNLSVTQVVEQMNAFSDEKYAQVKLSFYLRKLIDALPVETDTKGKELFRLWIGEAYWKRLMHQVPASDVLNTKLKRLVYFLVKHRMLWALRVLFRLNYYRIKSKKTSGYDLWD